MDLTSLPIANIIPSQPLLEQYLTSDHKRTIYFGIDPTATQIHLGHAVPIRILQQFCAAGHHVKFLIGDFTALIGDTSDKTSERPILTSEQIQANFRDYQSQAAKILDFSQIEVVYNSSWLQHLKFEDIIKLCQHFSTGDFVSRQLIRDRLSTGKHVGLHETLYPVMQGYDMYHLDADIQIGGTDQTYNMQAGRHLQKQLRGKDTFVITTPFLTGTDGLKMSKTSGNAIWLTDTPEDIYGKVMSLRDELILEYFLLATRLTTDQIQTLTGLHELPTISQLQENPHQQPTLNDPMTIKKILAHQITLELHSPEAADQAQSHFESTIQNKELPQDIPILNYSTTTTTSSQSTTHVTTTTPSTTTIDFLTQTNLSPSRGEARRLSEQGGLRLNNKQITDPNQPFPLKDDDIIQIGKRKIFKIKLISPDK